MMTTKQLADLTGISVRTLQYYDKINLLKPAERNDSGFRLYDDHSLFKLQQILFLKEIGLSLKEIISVFQVSVSDNKALLIKQKQLLKEKKIEIEKMLLQVELLIEGENTMNFEAYKKTLKAKIPNETTGEIRTQFLNLLAPDQAETIEKYWGFDNYFDSIDSNDMKVSNFKGFQQKGTDIIKLLLEESNVTKRGELVEEWVSFVQKFTGLEFTKVLSSLIDSYENNQMVIDSVEEIYGYGSARKLLNFLVNYSKSEKMGGRNEL